MKEFELNTGTRAITTVTVDGRQFDLDELSSLMGKVADGRIEASTASLAMIAKLEELEVLSHGEEFGFVEGLRFDELNLLIEDLVYES